MAGSSIEGFDQTFGEFKNEICVIYGPAGSGKTTIALLACLNAAKLKKKCLFLDAENGFPLERFKQIAGKDYESLLQYIFVLNVKSLEDQAKKISDLVNMARRFDIVVLDSIGSHFRKSYANDRQGSKIALETQVRILNEVSRTVPILMTNQVYENEDGVTMIGKDQVSRWCPRIMQLLKSPRKLIQERPVKKVSGFEIFNEGINLT